MKKVLLASALAMGWSGSAYAANQPTIVFTPGTYTVPPFTSAAVFEGFATGGVGTGQQFTTGSGVYAESKNGDVRVQPGSLSQSGVSVNPDGGADNYLSIVNGTFSVNFGVGVQVLSFVLGSLDNYNSVTLTFADNTSLLLTGLGIISATGAAQNTTPGVAPASFGQTGRVTYDAQGGSSITGVTFGSSQAAFEIDELAAAAPEPATWAMMILGFGLVGSQLRSRRRKTTVSFA